MDGQLGDERGARDPAGGRLAVVPLGVPERVVDAVERVHVRDEPVELVPATAPAEGEVTVDLAARALDTDVALIRALGGGYRPTEPPLASR